MPFFPLRKASKTDYGRRKEAELQRQGKLPGKFQASVLQLQLCRAQGKMNNSCLVQPTTEAAALTGSIPAATPSQQCSRRRPPPTATLPTRVTVSRTDPPPTPTVTITARPTPLPDAPLIPIAPPATSTATARRVALVIEI